MLNIMALSTLVAFGEYTNLKPIGSDSNNIHSWKVLKGTAISAAKKEVAKEIFYSWAEVGHLHNDFE